MTEVWIVFSEEQSRGRIQPKIPRFIRVFGDQETADEYAGASNKYMRSIDSNEYYYVVREPLFPG